jgi:hypothetical protein
VFSYHCRRSFGRKSKLSEFYFEIMASGGRPADSGGSGSARSGLLGPSPRPGTAGLRQQQSPLGYAMLPGVRPEDPPQRGTVISNAADVNRWRLRTGNNTTKLGYFLDNHMAMMKSRQFVINASVPTVANVYMYVGRRTILANHNVLACGSRYFEQLFRFQMTEQQAYYVRA